MPTGAEVTSGHRTAIRGLAREAFWFVTHSILALLSLGIVLSAMTLGHPDPVSASPKVLATVLALLGPMLCGLVLVRLGRSNPYAVVARYVWAAGLLFFGAVAVWVLDQPTGPGLCNGCGAGEKLWRTFFSIHHGSGLMGGDGLLVGTWVPLSLIGYAIGAALGLERKRARQSFSVMRDA